MLHVLPHDLQIEVLRHLNARDLARLKIVSKAWENALLESCVSYSLKAEGPHDLLSAMKDWWSWISLYCARVPSLRVIETPVPNMSTWPSSKSIACFRNLTELILLERPYGSSDMMVTREYMQRLTGLTALKTLMLAYYTVDEQKEADLTGGQPVLDFFKCFERLKALYLVIQCPPETFRFITPQLQVRGLPELEHLSIIGEHADISLDSASVQALEQLESLTLTKMMTLPNNKSVKASRLTSLAMRTSFENETQQLPLTLLEAPGLVELRLKFWGDVREDLLYKMASSLTYLDLEGCAAICNHLFQTNHALENLKTLNASVILCLADQPLLHNLRWFSSLENLDMHLVAVDDDIVAKELVSLPRLRHLYLAIDLQPPFVKIAASLCNVPSLESLQVNILHTEIEWWEPKFKMVEITCSTCDDHDGHGKGRSLSMKSLHMVFNCCDSVILEHNEGNPYTGKAAQFDVDTPDFWQHWKTKAMQQWQSTLRQLLEALSEHEHGSWADKQKVHLDFESPYFCEECAGHAGIVAKLSGSNFSGLKLCCQVLQRGRHLVARQEALEFGLMEGVTTTITSTHMLPWR